MLQPLSAAAPIDILLAGPTATNPQQRLAANEWDR